MNAAGNLYTTGQVATRLGVERWRLQYWVERKMIRGPTASVPGRRLFSDADIEHIGRQLAELNASMSSATDTGEVEP